MRESIQNSELEELRNEMQHVQNVLQSHPRNVQIRAKKQKAPVSDKSQSVISEQKFEVILPQLARDLTDLVRGEKDPSDLLDGFLKKDSSAYSQIAQYIFDNGMLGAFSVDSEVIPTWPLKYALSDKALPESTIRYLLKNGADQRNNKTDEAKSMLDKDTDIDADLLQLLLDTGYTFSIEDIIEICRDSFPSQLLMLQQKNLIDHNAKNYLVINPFFFASVETIHYIKKTIDSNLDDSSLMETVGSYGCLDALKYLLMHYTGDIEQIKPSLKKTFYAAAECDRLQIVLFLLFYSRSCPTPIYEKLEIEEAKKIAKGNVRVYFVCCDPEGKPKSGECYEGLLKESSEQAEVVEILLGRAEDDYVYNLASRDEFKFIKRNRWIHLALTMEDEKEIDSSADCMPRLTAINQLLPLNPFGVAYSWRQLRKSGLIKNYKEESDKILANLARNYKHYVQATSHIELSVHYNFIEALGEYNYLRERTATMSALRAIMVKLVLAPSGDSTSILPDSVFLIVAGYIAVKNLLGTAGLDHMIMALFFSEDSCKYKDCNVSLLADSKSLIFFSDKKPLIPKSPQKKVVVETSSSDKNSSSCTIS